MLINVMKNGGEAASHWLLTTKNPEVGFEIRSEPWLDEISHRRGGFHKRCRVCKAPFFN